VTGETAPPLLPGEVAVKRTLALALVLALGASTIPFGDDASAAKPCPMWPDVRGTIIMAGNGPQTDDPWTGVATGSYAGVVVVTETTNYFEGPSIRSVLAMTVTPRRGPVRHLVMDLLATNYTATALIGGGLLVERSGPGPDAATLNLSHVVLGPMEDRYGAPRVFTYDNTGMCNLDPSGPPSPWG
jgi:hypothetical protein